MKLAACYTVFNGEELLAASIEQIKNHVDEIIICYQEISNKGNKSATIHDFITGFVRNFKGKNIHLVYFSPDLSKNTKENERKKHQKLLDWAKILGCSHFFLSATDHFYNENEFIFGKNTAQVHNYDATFSKMYTYYKRPEWQLTPIEDYYMPFIMKLQPETVISREKAYPFLVDPSVQINTFKNYYLFEESDLMLHHYSMIRENILDKFKNAAASIRWPNGAAEKFAEEFETYNLEKNPGISYFQGRKIKIVPNFFNIKT